MTNLIRSAGGLGPEVANKFIRMATDFSGKAQKDFINIIGYSEEKEAAKFIAKLEGLEEEKEQINFINKEAETLDEKREARLTKIAESLPEEIRDKFLKLARSLKGEMKDNFLQLLEASELDEETRADFVKLTSTLGAKERDNLISTASTLDRESSTKFIDLAYTMPRTASYTFRINAAPGGEASGWPQLNLRVDGKDMAGWGLSGWGWRDNSVTLNLDGGEHRIEAAFVNDYGRRAIHLGDIKVNGTTIQGYAWLDNNATTGKTINLNSLNPNITTKEFINQAAELKGDTQTNFVKIASELKDQTQMKFLNVSTSVKGDAATKFVDITQNLDKEMQEKFINVTSSLSEENLSHKDVRTKMVNLASQLDEDTLPEFVELNDGLSGRQQKSLIHKMTNLPSEGQNWLTTALGYADHKGKLDNVLNNLPSGGDLDQTKQAVKKSLGMGDKEWEHFERTIAVASALKGEVRASFVKALGQYYGYIF
ncbi:hypothetical protein KJ693_05695 [bacterium]|nr:hypothetical protein [bacterium]MBU1614792.1 hypothetical protein [bacterium]